MTPQDELLPHLFRTEYSKIVSVLGKRFGFEHLEIAEDIAGDTFLTAAETWGLKGLPENPTAWLYSVAKNKAKNYVHRGSIFEKKIATVLKSNLTDFQSEIDLSDQNIQDSQLKMMFAICHPAIPPESQIGLSLRILCGFGVDEIANAFLTNKENINKRLFRAREILREGQISMEWPNPAEVSQRLNSVLSTIYLLFNEGYYSTNENTAIRKDLCLEAIRLTLLLVGNTKTNLPEVNALLSLMCFHTSRFDARIGDQGEVILYADQDPALWSGELIVKGEYYLNQSASGNQLSKYHLEAGIAYWHTHQKDSQEKWENILQLYNQLLQIEYSPVAALNRTYALYHANGVEEAIIEAEKLNLTGNHFYYTLLGELYRKIDPAKALDNFRKALALAKTVTDQKTLQEKIAALDGRG